MNQLATLDDDTLDKFRDRVRELAAGGLRVKGVDFRVGEDSEGNDALFVDVVLPDPAGETWPVDDVLELHRRIDDAAVELGVPVPWIVMPRQETREDYDPADTGDEARR
jgi:hypothetical protein